MVNYRQAPDNLTRLAVIIALAMAVILSPTLVLLNSAQAAGSGLDSLSAKAVDILHQDFQANGARNGDGGVGAIALYALGAAGIDTSTWSYAGVTLKDAVVALVIQEINDPAAVSAKSLAQDLLSMKTAGRSDLAEQILKILQARQKETGFDDNIYSNLNAYDLLGRGGYLDQLNITWAKDCLLSNQYRGANGNLYGWGSYKWKGAVHPDIMATCQAVRALSALDPQQTDAGVQATIKSTLQLLQQQQQSDGSFVAGMDDPVIDTAEVMITLKKLGLQPDAWVSGSGKSAVDYMAEKAPNADGSLGGCKNAMDAIWVLNACASSYALPVAATPTIGIAAPTIPLATASSAAPGARPAQADR